MRKKRGKNHLLTLGLVFVSLWVLITITAPIIMAQKEEEEKQALPPEVAPASPVIEQSGMPPEPVNVPPAVPPAMPEPAESEGSEPLIFNQAKIEQVVAAIKEQMGITIIVKGRAAGQRVDLITQNEPIETVLDKLTSPYRWVWNKIDDKTYQIMDEQTWLTLELPKQVQRKTFQLKNIKAVEAQKAIQGVLTKNIGSSAVDERTNKLFVTDLPQVLELVTRILEEVDVRLVTRVFYIKHANIKTIVDKIQVYKSPPGIIESDPKTHQIIVTDTFENIKRMEMVIEVLDIGPELKVYDITNMGIDGKLAKNIEEAVKNVVTEGAFWRLDVNAGKLIVEDMPEVHEKIAKILAFMDQPIKQVLIEAELVETNLAKTFDWTTQYNFSYDLNEGEFVKSPSNLRLANFTVSGGLTLDMLSKYLQAKIQTSITENKSKLLLQSRLLIRNGETASINVGKKLPYLTTFFQDDVNRNYYSSVTQNAVNVGLNVDIQPVISNKGLIELKVKISNRDGSPVKRIYNDKTYELIETSDKDTATVLVIPSGETRVIGGYMMNNATDKRGGIPILSSIPVVGQYLFGTKNTQDLKNDVLFFITPTIVEENGRLVKLINGKLVEEAPPQEGLFMPEEISSSTVEGMIEEGVTSPTQSAQLVSLPPTELPELKNLMSKNTTGRTSSYVPVFGAPSGVIGGTISPPAAQPPAPTAVPASPQPLTPSNVPGPVTPPELPGMPRPETQY